MAGPLLIFVIDDDDQVADTLVRMIDCLGHQAIRVESVQMEELVHAESKPDLVITDVFMPKVEGLTLIRMLQKGDFSDVPILAISGGGRILGSLRDVSNSYVAKAAVDFGATRFLAKPFSLAELQVAIEECRSDRPIAC